MSDKPEITQVLTVMVEALEGHGFRKRGAVFRRLAGELIWVITVEKNPYSTLVSQTVAALSSDGPGATKPWQRGSWLLYCYAAFLPLGHGVERGDLALAFTVGEPMDPAERIRVIASVTAAIADYVLSIDTVPRWWRRWTGAISHPASSFPGFGPEVLVERQVVWPAS